MPPTGQANPLVQGTLDVLIRWRPSRCATESTCVSSGSAGGLQVNAGSLFPAFRRLERDGLVKAGWRETENNPRAQFSALSPRGRASLEDHTDAWQTQASAVARILKVTREEI